MLAVVILKLCKKKKKVRPSRRYKSFPYFRERGHSSRGAGSSCCVSLFSGKNNKATLFHFFQTLSPYFHLARWTGSQDFSNDSPGQCLCSFRQEDNGSNPRSSGFSAFDPFFSPLLTPWVQPSKPATEHSDRGVTGILVVTLSLPSYVNDIPWLWMSRNRVACSAFTHKWILNTDISLSIYSELNPPTLDDWTHQELCEARPLSAPGTPEREKNVQNHFTQTVEGICHSNA